MYLTDAKQQTGTHTLSISPNRPFFLHIPSLELDPLYQAATRISVRIMYGETTSVRTRN